MYRGSLLNFESNVPEVSLILEDNSVKYNSFVGIKTELIHIEGGKIEMNNNVFKYNGYYSDRIETNNPSTVEKTFG